MRNLLTTLSLTTTLAAFACDVDDPSQLGEAVVYDEFAEDEALADEALAEEAQGDEARALVEDAPGALADDADPSLAGYCDNVTNWSATFVSFEDQVLALVNKQRASGAKCGGVTRKPVPALVKNTKLRCAARKHSRDMAVHDFTSHTGSNGSSPWARIKAAGYTYSAAAENIAWGWNTPQAVVDAWMKSTGHCDNIMSAKVTQLGVGYYKVSGSWQHYWTQDFGKP